MKAKNKTTEKSGGVAESAELKVACIRCGGVTQRMKKNVSNLILRCKVCESSFAHPLIDPTEEFDEHFFVLKHINNVLTVIEEDSQLTIKQINRGHLQIIVGIFVIIVLTIYTSVKFFWAPTFGILPYYIEHLETLIAFIALICVIVALTFIILNRDVIRLANGRIVLTSHPIPYFRKWGVEMFSASLNEAEQFYAARDDVEENMPSDFWKLVIRYRTGEEKVVMDTIDKPGEAVYLCHLMNRHLLSRNNDKPS
jgi:transcription elongation factor Elf1